MTEQERWECGRTLLLESLLKPDDRLRGCAFNQGCKDELLAIRDEVVEMVRAMNNPHTEAIPFGKKNNHVEPTISTPNGDISETLMSGTLGEYYMSEKREY
tara:strand:- start:357 stop:659 length:303 start_codon:yes stop_codon:yes gene_type:complete